MKPPNFNIILKSCASCCHCIIGDIDENATCEKYFWTLPHLLHVCDSWEVNDADEIRRI